MASVVQPTGTPRYYAALDGTDVLATGITQVGELTGSGYTLANSDDPNAYLGLLPVAAFPALPESGWLEQGAIYQYGGILVMVRQSHNRTIYPPEQTPALFVVYRPGASGVLAWVAGESVAVGMHRTYGGTEYVCLQAHVTQSDWAPPQTPALWQVYVPPPPQDAPWAYPVAYHVGDRVTYGGHTYRCLQAHTSIATWHPDVVPALWALVA